MYNGHQYAAVKLPDDRVSVFGNEFLLQYASDYEDAILMESAVRSGMDCIVTRNLEHFKPSSIPVYTSQEFIQTLNQPE